MRLIWFCASRTSEFFFKLSSLQHEKLGLFSFRDVASALSGFQTFMWGKGDLFRYFFRGRQILLDASQIVNCISIPSLCCLAEESGFILYIPGLWLYGKIYRFTLRATLLISSCIILFMMESMKNVRAASAD